MLNYVCKRLLGLIPTLLIVAVLVFLFVHMLPGDPARLIAGPEADATVIELVRQQLGLDQPLYMQFCTTLATFCRAILASRWCRVVRCRRRSPAALCPRSG
jgi:ABC-type dipeptide/oligopeptide/nickel transport system permease component